MLTLFQVYIILIVALVCLWMKFDVVFKSMRRLRGIRSNVPVLTRRDCVFIHPAQSKRRTIYGRLLLLSSIYKKEDVL